MPLRSTPVRPLVWSGPQVHLHSRNVAEPLMARGKKWLAVGPQLSPQPQHRHRHSLDQDLTGGGRGGINRISCISIQRTACFHPPCCFSTEPLHCPPSLPPTLYLTVQWDCSHASSGMVGSLDAVKCCWRFEMFWNAKIHAKNVYLKSLKYDC